MNKVLKFLIYRINTLDGCRDSAEDLKKLVFKHKLNEFRKGT